MARAFSFPATASSLHFAPKCNSSAVQLCGGDRFALVPLSRPLPAMSDVILLRYWACRGRAQPLRFLLADALGLPASSEEERQQTNRKWIDDQFPFDTGRWNEMKEVQEYSGPWGQLPVCKIGDGFLLAQTEAITRVVGEQLGYDGATAQEKHLCDSILCCIYQTLFAKCTAVLYSPGQEQEKRVEAVEAFRKQFKVFTTLNQGKQYLITDSQPLYCDFYVMDMVDQFERIVSSSILSTEFPAIYSVVERVRQRPNVAEYRRSGLVPTRWCGSPYEADVLSRLQSLEEPQ